MYSFSGMLDDRNRDVLFKKEKLADCWLYAFHDRKRAAKEEADYFKHHKGQPFDAQAMHESDERFGTIVFESDLDTDPPGHLQDVRREMAYRRMLLLLQECHGLR
jgi:hypothetical protein